MEAAGVHSASAWVVGGRKKEKEKKVVPVLT